MSLAPDDPRHGLNGYGNLGCRCKVCRNANRAAHADWRRHNAGTLSPDDPRHGTQNGYCNYGCRCDPCRDAHRAMLRAARARAAS